MTSSNNVFPHIIDRPQNQQNVYIGKFNTAGVSYLRGYREKTYSCGSSKLIKCTRIIRIKCDNTYIAFNTPRNRKSDLCSSYLFVFSNGEVVYERSCIFYFNNFVLYASYLVDKRGLVIPNTYWTSQQVLEWHYYHSR